METDMKDSMERKLGLDFARLLSAIGIISFHFYCHSASETKLFYEYANGLWGGTLNYLFFALSGLVVHMKYRDLGNIKLSQFYYKRWKAMMPAYVIVWFFAYLFNVTEHGKFFYMDIPKTRMLLTLIGMDGYASWSIPTYFITGEWFLGAVLIAYVCYPVLNRMIKKNELASLAVLFMIYEIRLCAPSLGIDQYFTLNAAVSPSTCLFSFFVGMVLAQHFEKLRNPTVVLLSFLCCTVGILVPVKGHNIAKELIIGCALLICLYNLGEWICRNKNVRAVVASLSGLTYYTFLLHHSIIYRVIYKFDSSNTVRALWVLCAIIFATFVLSKMLEIVMNSIMRSKAITHIDSVVKERG